MGFYAKHVLPRLIDLAMRNKDTTRLRAESVPQARGDVLEIGIGSGLNLPFYSSDVQRVYDVHGSWHSSFLPRRESRIYTASMPSGETKRRRLGIPMFLCKVT